MEIRSSYIYALYRKAWLLAVLSAFLCTGHVCANAQADTIRTLQGVEVGYKAPAQGVTTGIDGSYTVSSSGLRRGIRILGEADALAALQMMPGVAVGSDYSSGMSINGSDYSQNTYTLDGARVFSPYHFGGIYSTFNPAHVTRLTVNGSRRGVTSPYGVGGDIMAYTPDALVPATGGTANVGMTASSATLSMPMGSSASVMVSARASYLNALYGPMLDSDDSRIRYSFEDYNLTLLRRCGAHGTLKASGFYSTDRLGFGDGNMGLDSRLHWHNASGCVAYTYQTDDIAVDSRLSVSVHGSEVDMRLSQISLTMPSSVCQWAATGTVEWPRHSLQLGYRAEYTRYSPQTALASGTLVTATTVHDTGSWLISTGLSKDWHVGAVVINESSRLNGYLCGTYRRLGFETSLSVLYGTGAHSLLVNVGTHAQYMHHVGFSDIGLASNFYLPATCALPRQRSYGGDAVYRWAIDGPHLTLSAKTFCRWLLHSPEYDGDLLGLLAQGYDPAESVTDSEGYNVGGDLTVSYDYGPFSGWGGYSLAVCRRKFAGMGDMWVPSATEPLHSLKLYGQWRVSARVCLSAYFVLQSGRRYTPVEAVFIVGGNVLTDYGTRNSACLPLYHRLDLSATVQMPPMRVGARRLSSYVNVSLLNAYGHPNIEMQYFTYNEKDQTISLRRVQSLYRFMPSLSYTVEF